MTGHDGALAREGRPYRKRPASARLAEGVLSTANEPDRQRNPEYGPWQASLISWHWL